MTRYTSARSLSCRSLKPRNPSDPDTPAAENVGRAPVEQAARVRFGLIGVDIAVLLSSVLLAPRWGSDQDSTATSPSMSP
jgi:hypothetical protein